MIIDDAVARRAEAALAADMGIFVAGMARVDPAGGARREPVGGGWVAFTGAGLFANRAQAVGLDGPVGEAELDRIEAFLAGAGQRADLEVCPHAHPSLLANLAVRAYLPSGFRNVYIRRGDAPPPVTAGVTVEAADDTSFDEWSATLLDGFGYDDPADRARVGRWNRMMHEAPEAVLLLARVDGRPVGSGSVVLHGDVASLGGTAVRHAFRRRGVQAALLAARLAVAHEAGCELAVVTADPGSGSARNVQRAGFTLAYTNVRFTAPVNRANPA